MRLPSFITAVALSMSLMLSVGCGGKEPDRWADAGAKAKDDQAKKEDGKTPAAKVTKSGTFNKFFPKDAGDGIKLTPAADKDGYAEYKAEKDGKSAVLSIDDAEPSEKAKYKDAKDKVAGYPYYQLGANKSSILVADKYQVTITSAGGLLDVDARKKLFEKFDLAGLAKL